jgi:predicted SAM-dependent methyltransferase
MKIGKNMKIEYVSGFYDLENDGRRDFRWMQHNACIVVQEIVSGFVSFTYGMAEGSAAFLNIYGKSGEEHIPVFSGWHRICLDLNKLGGSELRFSCSHRVFAYPDQRELSLQLGEFFEPEPAIDLLDLSNNLAEEAACFIVANKLPEHTAAYIAEHGKRYAATLRFLRSKNFPLGNCLEGGRAGLFSHILEKAYPRSNFYSINTDLRQQSLIEENSLDSVILMEVFEHLTDPVGHHEIHLDGVFLALHELYRILKNDGKLFITTPNACSFKAIQRAINDLHPFHSPIHYREYTPKEIEGILGVYFEIMYIDTFDVFKEITIGEWSRDISDKLRGDDIFVMCKKKETSISKIDAHKQMYETIVPLFFSTHPLVDEVFVKKYATEP